MYKFLYFLLLSIPATAAAQKPETSIIRYDGIYRYGPVIEKNDTLNYCFRFYPNGKVIATTTEGSPEQIKGWFNLTMERPDIGSYVIKRRKLIFSTTSKEGTVKYRGKIITKDCFNLKTHSLINGYRSNETYVFVPISGLI